MARRQPGTLLPLEWRLLSAASDHQLRTGEPTYGYLLATLIATDDSGLLAHGTLYKALGRLVDRGLLEAAWESDAPPDRPRRRHYLVTGEGVRALAERPEHAPAQAVAPASRRQAPA